MPPTIRGGQTLCVLPQRDVQRIGGLPRQTERALVTCMKACIQLDALSIKRTLQAAIDRYPGLLALRVTLQLCEVVLCNRLFRGGKLVLYIAH